MVMKMDAETKASILKQAEIDLSAAEAETENLRRLIAYLRSSLPPQNSDPEVCHRFKIFHNIQDAAIEILKEQNRPMKALEIAKILAEGGYKTKNKSIHLLADTVYACLFRRKDMFSRISRGLWTLKNDAQTKSNQRQDDEDTAANLT